MENPIVYSIENLQILNRKKKARMEISLNLKAGTAYCLFGQKAENCSSILYSLARVPENSYSLATGKFSDVEFMDLFKEKKSKFQHRLGREIVLIPESANMLFNTSEKIGKQILVFLKQKGLNAEDAIRLGSTSLINFGFLQVEKTLNSYFDEMTCEQKFRLGYALYLAFDPVLVLVEDQRTAPLSAVLNLYANLQRLRKNNSVILMTAERAEYLNFLDRIFVIKEGAIVFEGTAQDVNDFSDNDWYAEIFSK